MDKDMYDQEKNLKEIEMHLEDLSIQFINILKQYREKGIIDDLQYQQHVKTKLNFLQFLKDKKEIQK